MYFVTNQPNAKMLTQYRKVTDVLASYVGKEFGGVAGPIGGPSWLTNLKRRGKVS